MTYMFLLVTVLDWCQNHQQEFVLYQSQICCTSDIPLLKNSLNSYKIKTQQDSYTNICNIIMLAKLSSKQHTYSVAIDKFPKKEENSQNAHK